MFIDPLMCFAQLMSMQSITHIHTNTHRHCHTHIHLCTLYNIDNCTACIDNKHRQAHIDNDIQSTLHILPHTHNNCTQLITPCDIYNVHCCVSKHITTACVQTHHCCIHACCSRSVSLYCCSCVSALYK